MIVRFVDIGGIAEIMFKLIFIISEMSADIVELCASHIVEVYEQLSFFFIPFISILLILIIGNYTF